MNAGTILKTKAGPSTTTTEYYSMYATQGAGLKIIGKVAESTAVGTYLSATTRSGVAYSLIQLVNPVVVGGTTYKTAYMQTRWLYGVTAPKEYYCTTTTLNLRSTPTSASLANVVGYAKKGQLVGLSDGTERNGFIQLTRASGKMVWASKIYLSTSQSSASSSGSSSSNSSSSGGASDPLSQQPSVLDKAEAGLENLVGTKGIDYVKWGAIALIVVFAIVQLTKVLGKDKTAKNHGKRK